ncbi:MAG: methionyl-tRNA formyltransferase [Hyphomicrobiaceae bacterium]|nr:methionyl-tRNA formyltransferase [Hyphomicrobiaceae bacterium]
MRIVFMGTPDFSVPVLSEIMAAGHEIVAVYCQPPRPAGRGMAERKSPVHAFAEAAGVPVLTPRSLRKPEAQTVFAAHEADVAVVVAYGLILPKPILDAPRHGCLNLHASKLPRWRGAAPIQRAIMAGDSETAAMVMQMDEGLDTGPVCLAEMVPIGPETTAGELHDELSVRGASLMVRALAALERDSLTATQQAEDGVTYAAKIDKSEARIDFHRPAAEVHNLIRGLSPFPGAWLEAPIGERRERIKILRSTMADGTGAHGEVLTDDLVIACGTGAIRLLELQRAGKKPMHAEELLRGFALSKGTRLG